MSLFKKYKWYFVASLALMVVFISIALWLYFATDAPQLGPFQYQVF